jgi:hypothetical protein
LILAPPLSLSVSAILPRALRHPLQRAPEEDDAMLPTWTRYLAAASADTDAMAAQAARVRRRSFYFGRCGCGVLVLPDVSTE